MANLTHVLKNSVQSTKSISQKENDNVYTFKVGKSSNKFQIKLVLESIFKVKVEKVRISRKKPFLKNRRTKTTLEKKAFVKLSDGYKIDDLGKIAEIMKNLVGQDDGNKENVDNFNIENHHSEESGIEETIDNQSTDEEVLEK